MNAIFRRLRRSLRFVGLFIILPCRLVADERQLAPAFSPPPPQFAFPAGRTVDPDPCVANDPRDPDTFPRSPEDLAPSLEFSAAPDDPPTGRAPVESRLSAPDAPGGFTSAQTLKRGDDDEDGSGAAGQNGGIDEVAPKIPTKRAPFAEEVGPPPDSPWTSRPTPGLDSFEPLPGLPVDTSFDSVVWVPQGPGLTKNGDLNIAPLHPTSGCVTAALPHPSNQNIIYIGTANGGVWRTDNALSANVRWRPLSDDQLSLSIGGMALDPADASGNTFVAGFGRRSSYSSLGGAHKGIIYTTDGGATWVRKGEGDLAGRNIYQLALRGSLILVAVTSTDNGTQPGLYRSTNLGATFTNVSGAGGTGLPAGACTHLVRDPGNATRYYAHVTGSGVYRSADGGATWTSVNTPGGNTRTVALAVASGGTIFAAELGSPEAVYRSTNQGGTWVKLDNVTVNTSNLFNGIAADPSDPNVVYLSGLFTRAGFPFAGRVVRGDASKPAGSQWTSIASIQSLGTGTAPHTDSRWLAFTAGNRLIECDDGGIYELDIADVGSEGTGTNDGGTWRSLNGDLRVSEMHSMAYDRLTRTFLGGAQDTGFQEQLLPGLPTTGNPGWNKTVNGDGGGAAVDLLATTDRSVRYGSAQRFSNFFRKTYDASNALTDTASPATTLVGGGTAIVRGSGGNMPFTAPVATNAVAGSRLIISGNANLYESTDGGDTVSQIAAFAANGIARIAYGGRLNGTNAPGVLFLGSGSSVAYRTAASGPIAGTLPFPGGTVQGVVLDPENWKNAWIIGNNTVYAADDLAANGATAFSNITGNLTGVGNFHAVEFLTLPTSGNAIVVGTDLGVFIMRLSAPGVWKTLGDNLPRAPVFVSQFDRTGQVLTISTLGRGVFLYDCKPVKLDSQWGETFQAYQPGDTVFPARTGGFFTSSPGNGGQLVGVSNRALQFTTTGAGASRSVFRVPDLNAGQPVSAFSAKWNALIYGNTSSGLADGMSFTLGPIGGISGAAFVNNTYATEDGFGVGLTVSVRTFSGNNPGYSVRVNGTTVPGGFVPKPMPDWGNLNLQRHAFEVDWRLDRGLTLRVDGVTIFANLPTPGFVPAAGDRFAWGARTGAFDEILQIDDLAIFTNGVLAPVPAGPPYAVSGEFPANNQTADKAFDGNPNTKWLAEDYIGFIGASFAGLKTVRAYTLTSSEDFPTRDPVSWDFQVGNDGLLWTQHGVQGAQNFPTRGERRTLVVANPTPATRFRLLIHENAGGNEIQLSEFQPLELVPVPPTFVVTNSADTGLGSLRQAIADAARYEDALITFAPALSGTTITLSSELVPSAPSSATVDASALPGGLTIDGGPGSNRILRVPGGVNFSLQGITFTGANGVGSESNGAGGAIINVGALTVRDCTFIGNSASSIGGAICNFGVANIIRCTLTGNSSPFGGAISNYSDLLVAHSTISGNSASSNGGGIDNGNGSSIILYLLYSIVAGNTASTGADIYNFNGTISRTGTSVVQGYAGIPPTGGSFIVAPPLLAPLDNYGGTTKTMALQPGSPARNNASGSVNSRDQRDFPIVGIPDIGAYEAGTLTTNFNAYIWETLPVSATVAQHAAGFDFDGDGQSNAREWLAGTNASSSTSLFRATLTEADGVSNLTFPTIVGRNYLVETSTDLLTWLPAQNYAGTGGTILFLYSNVSGAPRVFFRVTVGP